ncbi:hypothetical protein CERZMDRAFT_53003, partial [Cercospora zeae-maydis SCOH1-5]
NDPQTSVDAQDAPLDSNPHPVKKRRHKLEAVIAGDIGTSPNGESVDQDGDRRSKKHETVLGKFKKSAKRSPVPEEPVHDSKGPKLETVNRLEIPDAAPDDFVLDKESEQPEWLRKPIFVDSRAGKKSWTELKLDPSTCDRLAKLTFKGALPIQQALVPLLMPPGIGGAVYLPGSEKVLPDVVVSAPTGSGKTVSYLLPITEALRRSVSSTSQQRHLSAVIVVPTQELVTQVAAVAESLSKGSKVKIGQSNSKHSLREEQSKLHIIEIMLDPSWPRGFVPTHESLIDIFVATPQRLQDHLEDTQGFTLRNLTWLVLDEADRMLDNQHRSFLELLNRETHRELHVFRDYSGGKPLAEQPPRLRKLVLSATIPSDVKVEYSFQLQFPKLIVERGAKTHGDSGAEAYARRANASGEVQTTGDYLELPHNLGEFVVPVGDGSEKPLVAIELLNLATPAKSFGPTVLIFTSSTESANRLTHLLKVLVPTWKPHITTILKRQPRRTILQTSDPALIISTDRAGRGLDGFMGRMFTHVIQYDVPRSLTDYVHRVGRTARAERSGEAWTLLTHKQAGWFKEEIVRSEVLVRRVPVEEVKLARADDELREAYRVALETMREVVEGGKGKK